VNRVTQLSHLLTVLNSSVNYYIYCLKHRAPARSRGYSQTQNGDTVLTRISSKKTSFIVWPDAESKDLQNNS